MNLGLWIHPVAVGKDDKGHAQTIYLVHDARELLSKAPGVVVQDDLDKQLYPLATFAEGRDETFVGRIREDISLDNGLDMWVVSDNLLKGAALNAVQIAELL